MKLSDIVGNSGLSIYAQIALVIFVLAFIAIVIWLFRPGAKERFRRDARMPLDDDTPVEPRTPPKDDA